MTSKNCSKCFLIKKLSQYGICHKVNDGRAAACKECVNKSSKQRHKTKSGLAAKIYFGQVMSSKSRFHAPPLYSLNQFRQWLLSSKKFDKLFDEWVLSGYEKNHIPSVDRKDDYSPYTFNNISIMTWRGNLEKASSDKKNGINNKGGCTGNMPVTQMTKDGDYIATFHSCIEASRVTNAQSSHISACCKNKYGFKTAGGFKWAYSDKIKTKFEVKK